MPRSMVVHDEIYVPITQHCFECARRRVTNTRSTMHGSLHIAWVVANVAPTATNIALVRASPPLRTTLQSPPLRTTLHSRSHCGRHCSRRHGLPRRISKNVMTRRRSMACVDARTSMISKHPCELHSENSGGHLHPKSAQGWLKNLGAPLRRTQP